MICTIVCGGMIAKIRMVAMKRDMQAENEQPRSRVLSHVRNYSKVSIDALLHLSVHEKLSGVTI